MTDLSQFKQYLDLADQLTQFSSREDLAECVRILALNVAHYESKYGHLPLEETLTMLVTDEPNEAQVKLMTRGMETMVGVLGGIIQGFEPKQGH